MAVDFHSHQQMAGRARPQIRATNAAAVARAGTGPHPTSVMVNTKMEFKHPKYYAELRKRARQQAIQETVPHNDIDEANKRSSNEELESLKKYVKEKKKPIYKLSSWRRQASQPTLKGSSFKPESTSSRIR
jgi:dihydroorotase-like cyclic amidohydrolase